MKNFRFQNKKFVVLAEYFEQYLSNRQIAADIEEKWANQEKSFVEESVLFTFLRQTNGNRDTES